MLITDSKNPIRFGPKPPSKPETKKTKKKETSDEAGRYVWFLLGKTVLFNFVFPRRSVAKMTGKSVFSDIKSLKKRGPFLPKLGVGEAGKVTEGGGRKGGAKLFSYFSKQADHKMYPFHFSDFLPPCGCEQAVHPPSSSLVAHELTSIIGEHAWLHAGPLAWLTLPLARTRTHRSQARSVDAQTILRAFPNDNAAAT